jgi:hypothetical protein
MAAIATVPIRYPAPQHSDLVSEGEDLEVFVVVTDG